MSTVVAVAAMAIWLVLGTWRAMRWQGVRPPDLHQIPEPEGKWGAVQAFLGQQAHANVNRWRTTIVMAGLLFIVLVWGLVEDERRDDQREQDRQEQVERLERDRIERERREAEQACRIRAESRVEIRDAIATGVDAVAAYAEMDATERNEVVDQAARRVYAKLPPPDC